MHKTSTYKHRIASQRITPHKCSRYTYRCSVLTFGWNRSYPEQKFIIVRALHLAYAMATAMAMATDRPTSYSCTDTHSRSIVVCRSHTKYIIYEILMPYRMPRYTRKRKINCVCALRRRETMQRPATTDHSEYEWQRDDEQQNTRESVSKRVAAHSASIHTSTSSFVVRAVLRSSFIVHNTHDA